MIRTWKRFLNSSQIKERFHHPKYLKSYTCFYHTINQILLYDSEIWGPPNCNNNKVGIHVYTDILRVNYITIEILI